MATAARIALGGPIRPVWAPDYRKTLSERQDRLLRLKSDPSLMIGAREYYRTRPAEFIEHWCVTYDPRNAGRGDLPQYMPFLMFPKQREMVGFLHACLGGEVDGLIEKCRDAGMTWICCAFSVWLWLFYPGAAVGWGSRKESLVDKLGDADSIFEKIRIIILRLPREFWPKGFNPKDHMPFMRILNPENGSSITGESGDNIGRGGRKLIYFKDEAAHYERPEKIEAALGDNTRVQIDISSVNGPGNVFHRRREAGVLWQPGVELERGKAAVFIFDWRDDPRKDQAWYDARRRKAENEGLLHLFAQEVDRNYYAAVEGIIIESEWVKAAIDAHVVLGFGDDGGWCGGLDVADGGGDTNALALRKGVVLQSCDQWGERDVGATARRAIDACRTLRGPIELQYDSIGVGAGVKSEANRLEQDGGMPKGVRLIPWNAAAAVLEPEGRVEPMDRDSPLNKDFYGNLKAQGWWELRRRFYNTYRARVEGIAMPAEAMISLPSTLPQLRQIEKELSQPTKRFTGNMKLIVDKTPDGTKSPNLADAIMMAYWPIAGAKPYAISLWG